MTDEITYDEEPTDLPPGQVAWSDANGRWHVSGTGATLPTAAETEELNWKDLERRIQYLVDHPELSEGAWRLIRSMIAHLRRTTQRKLHEAMAEVVASHASLAKAPGDGLCVTAADMERECECGFCEEYRPLLNARQE